MTPVRALQLSNRWFATGVAAVIVRLALDLIGIDLFDVPLGVAVAICAAKFAWHSGWAVGYRARQHDETQEDA